MTWLGDEHGNGGSSHDVEILPAGEYDRLMDDRREYALFCERVYLAAVEHNSLRSLRLECLTRLRQLVVKQPSLVDVIDCGVSDQVKPAPPTGV